MNANPQPRPPLRFRPVSEVARRPVDWLWPLWLAPGQLTILEGDPSVTKSWLTLDLCARLSTGRAMPDGSPGPAPSGAILVTSEDQTADTIRPRLEAQGADIGRILVKDEDDDDLEGKWGHALFFL